MLVAFPCQKLPRLEQTHHHYHKRGFMQRWPEPTSITAHSVAALISSTSVLTEAVFNQVSTVPVLTNLTATASVGLVAVFTAAGTGGPVALTAGEFKVWLNLKDATKLP